MTDQNVGDVPDRSELIREFDDALDRVSRLLKQIVARELAETCGLSLLQVQALDALRRSGPEMEMRAIAAGTSLPASSVTSIIDRLVKLELVERRHSDVDRRRVVARITPAGEEVITWFIDWELKLLEQLLSQSGAEELAISIAVFTAAGERAQDIVEANRQRDRS